MKKLSAIRRWTVSCLALTLVAQACNLATAAPTAPSDTVAESPTINSTPEITSPAAKPATTFSLSATDTRQAEPGTAIFQAVLFGPFHLPETEFGPPYTGAFRALQPEEFMPILEAARKAGFHLIVNLAGGRHSYQAEDGAFSVERFKQRLDAFSQFDFDPYVANGTILGHMMFDEPQDPSNWNGAPVPFADIDAAAAYSKKLWPALPVGVGGPPSFLEAGAPWKALDFGFAQFTTRRGEAQIWLRQEVESAHKAHLSIVVSINILSGNNRNPVSGAQLAEWGRILVSEPAICGLLMWKYDPAYLQDPAVQAAIEEISKLARGRTAPACRP